MGNPSCPMYFQEENMTGKMTPEQLRAEVAKFDWYHKIDLGQGVITPGNDWDSLWNPIREVRRYIEYEGKKVLDIASALSLIN